MRLKEPFLIFAALFFTFQSFAQGDRARDSLALLDLYISTDGPNWTNTWDLNQPMNTWYGVTLNSDGSVDHLILTANNLSGNVSRDLGNCLLYTSPSPRD